MKTSYVLLLVSFAVLLFASATAGMEVEAEAELGLEVDRPCHPQCRWQCDDPSCPAVCTPVCERPKCQVHCEEPPVAACKIHCDKPQCNVRCPKDLCEADNCPKCETVCAPAKCRTACTAPNAVCTPMCEETKCDWKCKKPTLCPRPKCELVCEKPACAMRDAAKRHHGRPHGLGHLRREHALERREHRLERELAQERHLENVERHLESKLEAEHERHMENRLERHLENEFERERRQFLHGHGRNGTCCACSAKNVQHSMLQAGETVEGAEVMSFLEVMHTMKHKAQEQGAPACCACAPQ